MSIILYDLCYPLNNSLNTFASICNEAKTVFQQLDDLLEQASNPKLASGQE